MKIVNRIRNNPETFNEDRLIAKAKKYCWVEKVWGPKVQLIGLIFNLTRYNLRFLYRMLNEYLLTNVYRCHSSNCLETKPFIFRQINQTSVVKVRCDELPEYKHEYTPDFGITSRIHLCRNCIDDWICSDNCEDCFSFYDDGDRDYHDCKKNVKSLVCSLKSNKSSSIVYLQIRLDKNEYPEIYQEDIGKFRLPNGFLDKTYYPKFKKHLVYWYSHDPDNSGPE